MLPPVVTFNDELNILSKVTLTRAGFKHIHNTYLFGVFVFRVALPIECDVEVIENITICDVALHF